MEPGRGHSPLLGVRGIEVEELALGAYLNPQASARAAPDLLVLRPSPLAARVGPGALDPGLGLHGHGEMPATGLELSAGDFSRPSSEPTTVRAPDKGRAYSMAVVGSNRPERFRKT